LLAGASRGTVSGFISSEDFELDLSGASTLDMSGISVDDIGFDISGVSRVTGDITADDARCDISRAGRVELAGSADDIVVDVSGASSVELDDSPANNAEVKLNGASRGTVNLNSRLDINLSGASNIQYIKQPATDGIDISSGSTISSR
jgi:hypothetical protein